MQNVKRLLVVTTDKQTMTGVVCPVDSSRRYGGSSQCSALKASRPTF